MLRICFAILVAMSVGSAYADSPADVAALVKQLGDPKFASRELAQKELMKRGEAIVPELDKLAVTTDAETAERLRKIRYKLVGYKDDIRRLLSEMPERSYVGAVPVSEELRGLIADHQPAASDLLLSNLAKPREIFSQTLRTFVATWDHHTPDQIDRFVQLSFNPRVDHRAKYPAKVPILVSFRTYVVNGFEGWPPIRGEKLFAFASRTTCFVDGKVCDRPFDAHYPIARFGGFQLGELPEGKHSIHAVMEYEFTHREEKRKGEIRSKQSHFEVSAAHVVNTAVASTTVSSANFVRAALTVQSPRQQAKHGSNRIQDDWYEPIVRWESAQGKITGLRCPEWAVLAPVNVDLCFEVEVRDLKSNKSYPADPIVVQKRQSGRGFIIPRDARTFAAGKEGDVRFEITFKPSRAAAATSPSVTSFFPETITSKASINVYHCRSDADERPRK
jgi:hypothetical protein